MALKTFFEDGTEFEEPAPLKTFAEDGSEVKAGKPKLAPPKPKPKPKKAPRQPVSAGIFAPGAKPTESEATKRARLFGQELTGPPVEPGLDPEGLTYEIQGGPTARIATSKPSLSFDRSVTGLTHQGEPLQAVPVGVRRRTDETLDAYLKRAEAFEDAKKAQEQQARRERAQVRAKSLPMSRNLRQVVEEASPIAAAFMQSPGVGESIGGLLEWGSEKYPTTFQGGLQEGLRQAGFEGIKLMEALSGTKDGSLVAQALSQLPLPILNEKESEEYWVKQAQSLGTMFPALATSWHPVGRVLGTAYMGLQSGGEIYDDAINKGATPEEAFNASIPAIGIGLLQGLVGTGTGKWVENIAKGNIGSFAKNWAEEQFQEVILDQGLKNVNAKYVSGYDPKRALTEGMWETFLQTIPMATAFHAPGLAKGGLERSGVDFSIGSIPETAGVDLYAGVDPTLIREYLPRPETIRQLFTDIFAKFNRPDDYEAKYQGIDEATYKMLEQITNRKIDKLKEIGDFPHIAGQSKTGIDEVMNTPDLPERWAYNSHNHALWDPQVEEHYSRRFELIPNGPEELVITHKKSGEEIGRFLVTERDLDDPNDPMTLGLFAAARDSYFRNVRGEGPNLDITNKFIETYNDLASERISEQQYQIDSEARKMEKHIRRWADKKRWELKKQKQTVNEKGLPTRFGTHPQGIVVHKIPARNLKILIQNAGGDITKVKQPAPSLGIIHPEADFDSFGDVQLIATPSLIEEATKAKTAYPTDFYTPTVAEAMHKLKEYEITPDNVHKIVDAMVSQIKDKADRRLAYAKEIFSNPALFSSYAKAGGAWESHEALKSGLSYLKPARTKAIVPEFEETLAEQAQFDQARADLIDWFLENDFRSYTIGSALDQYLLTQLSKSELPTAAQLEEGLKKKLKEAGYEAKLAESEASQDPSSLSAVVANLAKSAAQAFEAFRNSPTIYMEIQPPRAVRLDEYVAALIPSDKAKTKPYRSKEAEAAAKIDRQEIAEQLASGGLKVYFYDSPEEKVALQKALAQFKDLTVDPSSRYGALYSNPVFDPEAWKRAKEAWMPEDPEVRLLREREYVANLHGYPRITYDDALGAEMHLRDLAKQEGRELTDKEQKYIDDLYEKADKVVNLAEEEKLDLSRIKLKVPTDPARTPTLYVPGSLFLKLGYSGARPTGVEAYGGLMLEDDSQSKNFRQKMAESLTLEEYREVDAQLRTAEAVARSRGIQGISITNRDSSFGNIRGNLRHESWHVGQTDATRATSLFDPSIIKETLLDLHSPDMNFHPLVKKAGESAMGKAVMKASGNYPDVLAMELSAYFAAGQNHEFGITDEEAAQYLTDYLSDIVENRGIKALDALVSRAWIKPSTKEVIQKVRSKYEGPREESTSVGTGTRESGTSQPRGAVPTIASIGDASRPGEGTGEEAGAGDVGAGEIGEGETQLGVDENKTSVFNLDTVTEPASPIPTIKATDINGNLVNIPFNTVQRIEESGDTLDFTKPQGLYTTPKNVTSPHEDLGGDKTTWIINPNGRYLAVPDAGPEVAMRPLTTFAGTGVHALNVLVGKAEANRIRGLSKEDLISYGKKLDPNVNWTRAYDRQDLVEQIAGILAKQAGYDAMYLADRNGQTEWDEFVVLTQNALMPDESIPSAFNLDTVGGQQPDAAEAAPPIEGPPSEPPAPPSSNQYASESFTSLRTEDSPILGTIVDDSPTGGPISPSDTGPPAPPSTEIGPFFHDEALLSAGINPHYIKNLMDKLRTVMMELGIKPNLTVPAHEQLMVAIGNRDIKTDEMIRALARHGITLDEWVEALDRTAELYGRGLQSFVLRNKAYQQMLADDPSLAKKLGNEQTLKLGISALEHTELGQGLFQRSADIIRKNYLSRLATAFTQVWSVQGQMPLDFVSGAMAGLGMRILNPKKWQTTPDAGLMQQAKESMLRGVIPVMEMVRGTNPIHIAKMLRTRSLQGHQQEYENVINILRKELPDIYGKLHGREGFKSTDENITGIDELESYLSNVKDPVQRREYAQKLRILKRRERFNKTLAGKSIKNYEEALNTILIPLSLQEYMYRRPVFVGALKRELEAQGISLADVLADPSLIRKYEKEVHIAVDEALRVTWAYEPRRDNKQVGAMDRGLEAAAYYTIKAINQFGPIATVAGQAFPRAFMNGLKFAYEWSPLGFANPAWEVTSKVRHGERETITFQETQRMAQAIIGTIMYGVALGLRETVGGPEWWQIKTGRKDKKGNPVYYDVRRIPQIAYFLGAADLAKRVKDGTMNHLSAWRRLSELYLNAQRQAAPGEMGTIDYFTKMSAGEAVPGTVGDKLLKRPIGDFAAIFVYPLVNIRDAYAQFNEEAGVKKDLRESPLTGPLLDKLPWLRNRLPNAEGPFETSPQLRAFSPISQGRRNPFDVVLGLTSTIGATPVTAGQNFAAREFSRLGLSPFRYLKRNPDPLIDRAQWRYFAEEIAKEGALLEKSPVYQKMSDREKAAEWEEILIGSPQQPGGLAAEARKAGEDANQDEMDVQELLKQEYPLRRRASGLDKEVEEMRKRNKERAKSP